MDLFLGKWPMGQRLDTLLLIGGYAFLFAVFINRLSKRLNILKGHVVPPDYPSAVPLLGHLVGMAWNSHGFLTEVISSFKGVPVRLNLLYTDFYVVSGTDHIKALFKESDLHTRAYKSMATKNILKMPKELLAFWLSDDSGVNLSPHSTSSVPPHLRIDYLHFSSVHRFLSGPSLKPFADRFTTNLLAQLSQRPDFGENWVHLPDLFSLMREEFLTASLRAMFGNYLLESSANFVQEYWDFHTAIYALAKGYPRWMKPKAHHDRDKCVESIKRWHNFIRPYFQDAELEREEWNPYYGTEYIKFRHMAWSKMDCMGPDAAAAEDLGLVWGANGNSIPASFWMVAEVIRRPQLLSKVSRIVRSCTVSLENQITFDWAKLCSEPLLQSIYAETLRLKVATFVFRSPDHKAFRLGKWAIPQNATMLVSSHSAQMDKDVWEVQENDRPVGDFWAERFLLYFQPNSKEPKAGETQQSHKSPSGTADDASKDMRFSLEGRATAWLPYGGGHRMCPGRHFAKQEMICGLAIMITLFDFELETEDGSLPPCNMDGYGFGALLPYGKTPVKIRRSYKEHKEAVE